MNKPAYAAIQVHSPLKPVLVFVASRRQTRLTALDLISHAAADERPTQWVHMEPGELAVSEDEEHSSAAGGFCVCCFGSRGWHAIRPVTSALRADCCC
jgi:hypothetical protein